MRVAAETIKVAGMPSVASQLVIPATEGVEVRQKDHKCRVILGNLPRPCLER